MMNFERFYWGVFPTRYLIRSGRPILMQARTAWCPRRFLLLVNLAWLGVAFGHLSCSGGQSSGGDDNQVVYTITFNSTWSEDSHPVAFPPNAHLSTLVGASHDASFSMWSTGQPASAGIQQVAETGSTTLVEQEIEDAGTHIGQLILSTGGISSSPGSLTVEITMSPDYPYLSLASMLAPSPDWFVGVQGLLLFANDEWVSQSKVSIYPYDAGTDSGDTYNAEDQATSPHQNIVQITSTPFDSVASLGQFTFVKGGSE